jgi:molecular chaperone GrpE
MEEKQPSQNRPASDTYQADNGAQQAQAEQEQRVAGQGELAEAQQPAGQNSQSDTDNAAAEAKALEEAHAKIAELHESFLRACAETDNVRRRAQEDVAKAHKFAIESFAENLLPVLDSLEAALADTSGDLAKVREGVELTLRQLTSALEKGRVTQINPVGEKFDPHRHQAISMVPADQEANTVVSVLQKGYVIADRVLRPALVTVAAPK